MLHVKQNPGSNYISNENITGKTNYYYINIIGNRVAMLLPLTREVEVEVIGSIH